MIEDKKFLEEQKKDKLTTIAISRHNRLILQKMGYAGESFNDVLNRLLENQEMLESVSRVGPRDTQTLTTITNTLPPPSFVEEEGTH